MKNHITLSTTISLLLGGIAMAGVSRTAMASWSIDSPPGSTQCTAVDINDANIKVINCLLTNNTRAVFAKVGPATAVQLQPLVTTPGGVPCIGTGINNPASGAFIVGECRDANNVWQAVAWPSNNLTASPTLLNPVAGLLGLGAGVKTVTTAINKGGTMLGESIANDGTMTPGFWQGLSTGTFTALTAPLISGGINNCEVVDDSDAATPNLVGNCPSGGSGKNLPVLWASTTSAYVTLPVPAGASFCTVGQINAANQMLGECIFGTDSYKAVRWAAGGASAPVVLASLNGTSTLRSTAVDMNDNGVVIGSSPSGGANPGQSICWRWDPSSGSNGVSVTLPAGGAQCDPSSIGNNGEMFVNYEVTASGTAEDGYVPSGGTTVFDGGACAGGKDTVTAVSSPSGLLDAGACTSATGDSRAIEGSLP